MTDSMDGFSASGWTNYRDRAEFANCAVNSLPVPSRRAASRISASCASGGGTERQRASRLIRAHLPSIEKRSGKGAEGTATIHEWTPAGVGRIRFAWRSSLEPLPARVLPISRAGELDGVRRIGGAGEHESNGMV